ncbi:hypothetical protein AB1Y20_000725 [Prymnesium parvum]|uniref:Uncharacterized protein n=1 Tax=Prymnesium parvum TaxID=97485 RepID=A0AB34K650_PRYPA
MHAREPATRLEVGGRATAGHKLQRMIRPMLVFIFCVQPAVVGEEFLQSWQLPFDADVNSGFVAENSGTKQITVDKGWLNIAYRANLTFTLLIQIGFLISCSVGP